jgi:glycosyltransferase involved in cell wall biosynthesis
MFPQKKIRILQTIRQGLIGGGESHLLSLCEHMDNSKFESVVLSFSPGPMVDRLNKMGIPVFVIETEKPFNFLIWKQVRKLIEKEEIDIIHAHGTRAASNVFYSARHLDIPMIYSIHAWSFHNNQNIFTKNLRIMGERFLTAQASKNISVSHGNKKTGQRLIKGFDSKVIYNGIDLKRFNPAGEFRKIRSELNISDTDTVCIFLARFEEQKQPLVLIRCFTHVLSMNESLHLIMVGDGPLKEASIKLAEDLQVTHRIHFLPFRQDVPDLLASSDVYILPSLWEGMPIGLIEAMAMEKAVIATEVDGSSEIIRHKQNGWLISTNGLEENLTSALKVMLDQDDLRKALQYEARKSVLSEFNVETMTKKIEAVYRETAGIREPD